MIIVPAIDLIDGHCVRLTKGDYNTTKVYNTNPVEVAQEFEAAGLSHLHLVDLDGARKREVVNWNVLEEIAKNTQLKIDFSGGLSSGEQVQKALDLGAYKVTVGSIAVKKLGMFKEWLKVFGTDKIILGADVLNNNIAIHGWESVSDVNILSFLNGFYRWQVRHIMCTDVSKDGMLEGPSIELYKSIIEKYPKVQLVASGGVSNLDDLKELEEIGCAYAIVGKAIYEGKISLAELAAICSANTSEG